MLTCWLILSDVLKHQNDIVDNPIFIKDFLHNIPSNIVDKIQQTATGSKNQMI